MKKWVTGDLMAKRRTLITNKHKYAMFKNDLVMCVNQSMTKSGNVLTGVQNKAYPNVVSNLGDVTDEVKTWLKGVYASATPAEFKKTAEDTSSLSEPTKDICKNMPFFMPQGYALGTAWACQTSGDTVASVLIGGMQTVLNGHFECQVGDILHWYFDFEADNWHLATTATGQSASRKTSESANLINDRDAKRQKFFSDFDGTKDGGDQKTNRFLPKPYRMYTADNGVTFNDHFGDRIRIFAKCLSCARPFEMVDIMLMTQSL